MQKETVGTALYVSSSSNLEDENDVDDEDFRFQSSSFAQTPSTSKPKRLKSVIATPEVAATSFYRYARKSPHILLTVKCSSSWIDISSW
jgi:hypothetical protein